MRRILACFVLALVTLAPTIGSGADQSTPEEVVERAMDALNHGKLDLFIRAVHPDALAETRTMVNEVFDVAIQQGKGDLFVKSFPGVKDAAALRALDAPGLLTVMLAKVTADPELKQVLAATKVEALGRTVNPAKDLAYVVYRTRSKFGEMDIVRLYPASLRKSGTEWKMALPDDMDGQFKSMKQEISGTRGRPDFAKTKVEPLGHVMDGKSTALVIYRKSVPMGDSAMTSLAVASVDVRDAAWDAVLKDDVPAVTALLDRKLGLGRQQTPVEVVVPPEAVAGDKAREAANQARAAERTAQFRDKMKAEADERQAARKAEAAEGDAKFKAELDARTAASRADFEARAAASKAKADAKRQGLATLGPASRSSVNAAKTTAAGSTAPEGYVDLPATFFGGDRDRFHDVAPAGGLLVGVKVSYIVKFGGNKTSSVQPIYRVGAKLVDGKRQGTLLGKETKAVAKEGYAVGGINTHTGLSVDGFELVFMKVDGDHLDPADSYNSPWLGDEKGGSPRNVASDGKIPVGLQGRAAKEVNALGLIVPAGEAGP